MRIEIDIPKEFEEHFTQDKFKDSFERIMADLKNCLCAGRYEYETIEMLEKAFEDSRQAYDVDKVVEELEKLKDKGSVTKTEKLITKSCVDKAIEIVKQGGIRKDV